MQNKSHNRSREQTSSRETIILKICRKCRSLHTYYYKYTSLSLSPLKSKTASAVTFSRATVQKISSPWQSRTMMEQLPPITATWLGNQPSLPTVMLYAPSGSCVSYYVGRLRGCCVIVRLVIGERGRFVRVMTLFRIICCFHY